MTDSGSVLTISRRWLSLLNLGFAFELPLCAVLFYVAGHLLIGVAEGAPVQAWVAPCVLLAAALALAYHSACNLVNHTVIRVTSQALTLEHKPLPWPGRRALRSKEIQQLYCESKSHSQSDSGGYTFTYSLYALDSNDNRVCLVKGLLVPDQVRFAEQEIERFLGIKDRPVPGELTREEPEP